MNMSSRAAALHYQIELHGYGTLSNEALIDCEVVFSLIGSRYDPTDPWRFRARPRDGNDSLLPLVTHLNSGVLKFSGVTDDFTRVDIPEVCLPHTTSRQLDGHVYSLSVDAQDLDGQPDGQHVEVYLTPTPLAWSPMEVQIKSRTGEAHHLDRSREPFRWTSQFGPVEFSSLISHERGATNGFRAEVEILEPVIRLQVAAEHMTSRIAPMLDHLEEEIQDWLYILGLLGRQRCLWTRISVSSRTGDTVATAERWRRGLNTSRPTFLRPMIAPDRTAEALSGVFLAALQTLPFKAAACRTIDLLASSYETSTNFAFLQFLSAFAALETITGAIAEDHQIAYLMSTKEFRKVRRRVREVIRTYWAEAPSEPGVCSQMLMKIPELRRPPFVEHVVSILDEKQVDWRRFWRKDGDPLKGFRATYTRRNALVHGGSEPPLDTLKADHFRVHAVAELLLFDVLGGDSTWLHRLAYEHCEWSS